jgi:hypothetical protein
MMKQLEDMINAILSILESSEQTRQELKRDVLEVAAAHSQIN